jgi:hypothetical protein
LYLHPDAAGGWLPSGDPIDAGTMHHLAHNLSLMCRESHRHLVADVGPGKMPRNGSTYTGNGWDGGYTDGVNTASTDVDYAGRAIAWDRRTARSYHLANLIADRKLPGGGYGLRVIEVEIDCYLSTANTLQLFAALTASYNTPDQGSLATSTWSDWSSATFTGNTDGLNPPDTLPSGRQTVRLWLITKTPAGASWAQWKARDSATVAAAASMVYEGHLWVGWRSSNSDNAIISINAWEVPPPFAPLADPMLGGTANGDLFMWARSDTNDTMAQDTGSDIQTWFNLMYSDSSGPFSLGFTNSAPTLKTSGIGGLPVAEFVGDVGFQSGRIGGYGSLPETIDEFTIFAVVVPRSTNTTGYRAVFSAEGIPPRTDGGAGLMQSGGEWGAWSEDRTTGFCGTGLTLNKPYILCARADATDVFFDVNGIQSDTVARPAASGATRLTMVTGQSINSGANAYTGDGDFDLAEIIMYHRHLGVAERAFVLEYLNRRYGVF